MGKKSKQLPYVLVRADRAGVFVGQVESRTGSEIVLRDSRRVWYWDGAASLSQLAQSGTVCPEKCKMPEPVGRMLILGVIEVIDVTAAARKTLDAVPVWRR
jgi:hypothetical protein